MTTPPESTLATALDRMRVFLAALDAAGIPNDTALLDIREENGYLHVLCPADLRTILAATPTTAHVEALDPAYKDVEVCSCPTPGWTHHTGFHAFVEDRVKRATRSTAAHVAELEAALAAAEARLRAVEALADWCDQQILGYSYRPRDIATSIRAALTPPQPAP